MTWSERVVQLHRKRTDAAIHHAYRRLALDRAATAAFSELLICSRKRAPNLLGAPMINASHPGVEALVNLSRFRCAAVRPVSTWPGTSASWHCAVASLANHLVCRYEVPRFLASSWSGTGTNGDHQRGWVLSHSRGAPFRSLDLPTVMTRKMERIFLASPDHLEIGPAMRRAELLALHAPASIVDAVLATRRAALWTNSDFWHTFWRFLVANASNIDPSQIGPLIDWLQAIRHDKVHVQTSDGLVERDPPQPDFSLKGRTAASMLRQMAEWHRSLGGSGSTLSWKPSPYQPMLLEEPASEETDLPRIWQMVELTTAAQLRAEGVALHHCVASYAYRCFVGDCRIWSLRVWRGDRVRHLLTVEIKPTLRRIVQARGYANSLARGKPLDILRRWASRENLWLGIQ